MNNNSHMIVAFDGLDNVGKGSQITLLRKHFSSHNFVILNIDKPIGKTNGQKLQYGKQNSINTLESLALLNNNGFSCIADRIHFTEYAYSILRGGHSLATFKEIEESYDASLENLIIIRFHDELENIIDRDDGASAYTKDDLKSLEAIENRFQEAEKHSRFTVYSISITNKDIPTVHEEVVTTITNHFSG